MSSSDFSKKLVYDDRLMCSPDVDFAVIKGGSQVTQAQYAAISASNSSVVFNIQVPSENIIVDRRVMFTAEISLDVTYQTNNAATLPKYGDNFALCAFPLHAIMSTMSATINNNTVSMNTSEVLAQLLRMNDIRELQAYNGLTPTAFDTYQKYSDAASAVNNPLGSYTNTGDNDLLPRGAFPFATGGQFTPVLNANNAVNTSTIKFKITEPLLLSPFVWGNTKAAGMYGIQNLNFNFNVGNVARAVRTALTGAQVISVVGTPNALFSNASLQFTYITPPPELLLSAKNSVPFAEFPRYSSTSTVAANGAYRITPPALQLNSVPDKLIICLRKPIANQTYLDTDSFIPIDNVAISWNNQAGLLSSAQPQDLYRFSRDAGSNQSWLEFSGKANKNFAGAAAVGGAETINTSGSLLVLDFAKTIALSDSVYAPSSLGQFNLQITLVGTNNTALTTLECCIITMNSGVFVSERGSSSSYLGILSKSDVLEASAQEPVGHKTLQRLTGGGFLDNLKTAFAKVAPIAKIGLAMVPHPAAKVASAGLGALGYGRSGGRRHSKLM